MDIYGCERVKYDVPLNHLDHKYISECKDIKELEKILKILRSGKEGVYPDLEKLAEEKLQIIDSKNKLLRKSGKAITPNELEKEEWKEIEEDLENWMDEVKSNEKNLKINNKSFEDEMKNNSGFTDEMPPIRSTISYKISSDKKSSSNEQNMKTKRVKPRDYREWDKFDVDAELNKIEQMNGSGDGIEFIKTENGSSKRLDESVSSLGLTNELKEMKANRERDKGNEAFKAGDLDEALLYYNRSISLLPLAAAYNNRALVYLRQKKWNKALDDCNIVLEMDADNLKAFLRRASAYQGLSRYQQSKKDLEFVLNKEPNNKQALSILKTVDKTLSDQKVKGRRLKIEEITSDEDEYKNKNKDDENKAKNNDKEATDQVEMKNNNDERKNIEKTSKDEEMNPPLSSLDKDEEMNPPLSSLDKDEEMNTPLSSLDKDEEMKTKIKPALVSLDKDKEMKTDQPLLPLDKDVLFLKDSGNELFRTGQYGDALMKYDEAIRKLTGFDDNKLDVISLSILFSNRAACKMKIGECRGCIDDCNVAIKYQPNSAKPYLRRAMAYEQLEKYKEAFVDYKQLLNAGNATNAAAQQGADRCSSILQQTEGTGWRDRLTSFSHLNPSYYVQSFSSSSSSPAEAEMVLPLVLPQPAPATFVQDSSDKDGIFEKYKTRGNSFFAKGDYVKAVDCFTKCIECEEDQVVPFTNRALCYLKLFMYDKVLNDCNEALSLEFHNIKALYRRALAYKMKEKYEESLIDLETLLKIDPKNTSAKKELEQVIQLKAEMKQKKAHETCLRKKQKLRQRIKIEEIETSSEEEEEHDLQKIKDGNISVSQKESNSSSSSHSSHLSSNERLSSLSSTAGAGVKMTPYSFLQMLKTMKLREDVDSHLLLNQTQPKDLTKLINNNLDGDILLNLLRCFRSLLKTGEDVKSFEYLLNLTKVPRFDMVVMFLSASDKSEIGEIFNQLSASTKLGLNLSLIEEMRNKYGLL